MTYQFLRDFLFGNPNFEFKLTSNILLNELMNEITRVFGNVTDIVRSGGILKSEMLIHNDLKKVLKYIERGNNYHFERSNIQTKSPPHFQSEAIQHFFYKLCQICRGDLTNGAVSNTYQLKRSPPQEQSDAETLKHILNDDHEFFFVFRDAEYWGNLAKELIRKNRPFQITPISIPNQFFRDVQIIYDLTCQSKGSAINPFSYAFVPHDHCFDPIHFKTADSLKLFIEHCPENDLSKTIRHFINLTIKSIMDADMNLLPSNVFDHEIQIRKFIKNINFIHTRIEKVSGSDTPLKLVDVIQRLLALLKYDYLWENFSIHDFLSEKKESPFLNIYLRNIELERENDMLKRILASHKNDDAFLLSSSS